LAKTTRNSVGEEESGHWNVYGSTDLRCHFANRWVKPKIRLFKAV